MSQAPTSESIYVMLQETFDFWVVLAVTVTGVKDSWKAVHHIFVIVIYYRQFVGCLYNIVNLSVSSTGVQVFISG